MIRSIAVVPHPPLLVPQLVGAAAEEAEPLRTACQQAVRRLRCPRWYAVGVDETGPAVLASGTGGTFRGYGVDVAVTLGATATDRCAETPGRAAAELALPMLVAGWLAGQAGATTVVGELLAPTATTEHCLHRGGELAGELTGDWSLVVLADGARTHQAPGAGRVDERAATFDAGVADALATADAAALAGIDADLAAELGAQGRAAWQLLAGVAMGSGARWTSELLFSGAPYGVGYHVALWLAAP